MRIAVLSDIHGNIEAFREILRNIEHRGVDLIINLGDSIGYGPDPRQVIDLIRKSSIVNISGNHEQAILNQSYRQNLVQSARKSIERTIKFLSAESILYLKTLPLVQITEGAIFVHGCPPDSSTTYLNHMTFSEIVTAFKSFSEQICFVGHTHKVMLIIYDGESAFFSTMKKGTIKLVPNNRYLVNVGSVGLPRDNDPRAGYVIWDKNRNSIKVIRIPYDIKATAEKIINRGFQKQDADRLFKAR